MRAARALVSVLSSLYVSALFFFPRSPFPDRFCHFVFRGRKNVTTLVVYPATAPPGSFILALSPPFAHGVLQLSDLFFYRLRYIQQPGEIASSALPKEELCSLTEHTIKAQLGTLRAWFIKAASITPDGAFIPALKSWLPHHAH